MPRPIDLNQLRTLEVLLDECSVTRTARRLNTSSATISRALARIREDFGDEILVPSGRGLAPTQRAIDLLPLVRDILETARGLYDVAPMPDLRRLAPLFTVVIAEAVMEAYGAALTAAIWRECPDARVHCLDEVPVLENDRLRRGEVDLYIGAFGEMRSEIRRQTIRSGFTRGAVRAGHPLLSRRADIAGIMEYGHVMVSRDGAMRQPIDDVIARHSAQKRRITLVVSTYAMALSIVQTTDLILGLPDFLLDSPMVDSHNVVLLPEPAPTAPFDIFQAWHPRFGNDPVHRWLRGVVQRTIA